MIDFRYHLVSLISVFLALAIGVVLGAGPLQNSLGTALNDQVSSLREDRNNIQTQLEQTETAVNDRDEYITQSALAYLPGTLSDHKVALVVMPEALNEDVDAVSTQLQNAGATIVGRVSLTTAWVESSRETFRSTYSGQFAGYMDTPATATGNTVLGMGLGTALTSTQSNASSLSDLLTASDTPLMSIDAALSEQADCVVAIGPRSAESTSDKSSDSATQGVDLSSWNDAIGGLAAVTPTVVLGAADADTDLVTQLRKSSTAVTTVDSVGQAAAMVSAPLALADTIAGTVGAYGFDDGAQEVMPPLSQSTDSSANK